MSGIARTIADLVEGELPLRLSAYDGSVAGRVDAEVGLELRSERGLSYVLTAPGDLGMARAYVMGDLALTGVHPGDPYDLMLLVKDDLRFRRPTGGEAAALLRTVSPRRLLPPPLPEQERLPRWRRAMEGVRHSLARDADDIAHHYDVSNRFYELVLGPSMAYTCALFRDEGDTLEQAQAAKFDLICRKLDLQPGQRLLDVGCGWGGMVMHAAHEYGVSALGVTLSRSQADWAAAAIERAGLADRVEVRHLDYRKVTETGFDAVSSIGLTEHVGVRNYSAYFGHLHDRLRPGGRLLNHCITRAHNRRQETGAFIDRYVFPDGELTGSGTIIAAAQDAGLEVQHAENLRAHYALTLAQWSRNLAAHWEECVAEVGEATARVWGLYLAGSRVAFERGEIELHHVLATRALDRGRSGFPLRPDWTP